MKIFNSRTLMAMAVALGVTLSLAFGLSGAAQASDKSVVEAAQAQGIVGEQGDGYLGIRGNASDEVKAAVAAINKGRAGVYARVAAEAGTSPQAAGEGQAKKQFDDLPAGYYFKPLGGTWTQK